jgi:hypothetical protein
MSCIFWYMTACSPEKSSDVSEEYIDSIFRVEDYMSSMLISCFTYSSTVTMKAIYSSETSVDLHRTAWRYIRKNKILHVVHCFNVTSMNMSRDSSGGIETGYGLRGRGSIPGTARCFSSPRCPDRLWDPPGHLSTGYRRILPRG